jgi:glycosyltransferase involved in cell wall biosynthesis
LTDTHKNKIRLSAVVVAHNEEYHLGDCLKTLSFVDELVVVLDKCSDKSKEIALKYTKNIVEGSWDIEGERRNIALDNCSGEWVLELDADERISENLKQEIISKISSNIECNFEAKIYNHIGNRLVKYGWLRSIAVYERQFIHRNGNKKYAEDRSIHPIANLVGEVIMLDNPIIHYMDKDIADLINRFNRYTSLRANDVVSSGKEIKKSELLSLLLSFINRFFKAFIKHKGYKDGGLGLFVSILCSSYDLVANLKAIELQK